LSGQWASLRAAYRIGPKRTDDSFDQACRIAIAFLRQADDRAKSIPAAGTRPNGESIEYRPPRFGRPQKDATETMAAGLVLADRPGDTREKIVLQALGSVVVPDLLDTMNSVRVISITASVP
jgi:hypothetical protein